MFRSVSLTNYAFSVLKQSKIIKCNEFLRAVNNNAIYLPIFYSFINHNLNSTNLFNSLSRFQTGQVAGCQGHFSISTKVTAGTWDAYWLKSEAQQCISRRTAQKPTEILAGKRHNADNALTDFKCLWRKDEFTQCKEENKNVSLAQT